jgi:2'-5' RNA ligase
MRLFVAIDIPEAVKDELRALLSLLRPLAKLSWSSLANGRRSAWRK